MATKKIAKNVIATTPEIVDAESIDQISCANPVIVEKFRYYVKELPGLWGYEYHKLPDGQEKMDKLANILIYCVVKRDGSPLFLSSDDVNKIPFRTLQGLIQAVMNNADSDGTDKSTGKTVTDPKESNPILTSDSPTD